jgi:DNA-binding NtrC family response regulator
LQNRELAIRHRRLEEDLSRNNVLKGMIGKSAAIRSVFDLISRAAPSKASVLITGESGVGKELVAHALHELSPRKAKPLVSVHCAALSESLLESELFGHEKGAFTGAASRRRGRFELANEGTLFLDEIGEIDQNIQIKLLRVLQEKKYERLGGEETLEADVRLLAATNRDLKTEIEKGRFREDLYYRLNVVTILVPPLRERKDDIPLLINSFIKEFAAENNKEISGIDEKARAMLYRYDWPGNIRELRNCIESTVVMSKSSVITTGDLPPTISDAVRDAVISDEQNIPIPMGTKLEDAENIVIQHTLTAQNGNKSRTAELLGIGRKTLDRKLGQR